MKTRGIRSLRLLAYTAAALVVLAITGDRGLAVGVPATVYGLDPLEVLELKVRPNVFVVLDSSGSMQEMLQYPAQPPVVPNATYNLGSGDHPRSKMRLAKEVLRSVIANNQSNVSFLFGQYTQNNSRGLNNNNAAYTNPGSHRFQYVANNDPDMGGSASMTTTELTVLGDVPANNRGLQSWQDIRPAWNTIYYQEDQAVDAVCTAVLPGTFPKFYATGAALATDMATAMNNATCTPARTAGFNVYTVTYAAATGAFTFARTAAGTRNFAMLWGNTPNNIRGALGLPTAGNTALGTTFTSGNSYTLLYRANSTATSGAGLNTVWKFFEPIDPDGPGALPQRTVTYYDMRAGRLFNGETIKVLANGTVCDMVYPTLPLPAGLPKFYVQEVASCGGANVNGPVTFGWGGTKFSGNSISCNGFSAKVPLIPCDLQSPPAPTQITTISPYTEYEMQFDATGAALNYTESQNGAWSATSVPLNTLPAKADGSTPIANSLANIKTLFTNLWTTGQAGATTMAGPPPYRLDPISTHRNPKEKTIVLFVTDGDDTCGSGADNDEDALQAAYQAELLYRRIAAAEPASSVQTYMIGFGNGAAPYRLNWIAWGGSGLGNPTIGNNGTRWTPGFSGTYYQDCRAGSKCESINNSLRTLRASCSTCTDAFVAPDSTTLALQLQSIIDQGASDGEFSAQQSITESVFEYLDPSQLLGTPPKAYDASNPKTRFGAIVPTRFVTSFSLPGFKGQLKAYQNDGSGNSVLVWSAGDKLWHLVSSSMSGCGGTGGAAAGECVMAQISGTGTGQIRRRVYTTDRNGVYAYTPDSLIDAGVTPPASRVNLWPPQSNVAPNDYTSEGILDVELGLPGNGAAAPATEFTALQTKYRACLGTTLPGGCTSATPLTRMQAARREAREMILAFMAGGAPVPATGVTGWKRSTGAIGTAPAGSLLYKARSWVLGDSEMATAAVITPPQIDAPTATPYGGEYDLYTKGPRNAGGSNPGGNAQIKEGVGLALPDDDADPTIPAALDPVMSVIYLPANDMLHAFRAGPNVAATGCARDTNPADAITVPDTVQVNASRDCGGEEMWGFVPYDQLASVALRFQNEPQGRNNHVYMLARGIRFGDVFVPGTVTRTLAGQAPPAGTQGVWRRFMFFGRGIGGKHVTALDVTGPGAYTERYYNTAGPIPIWNRGNPDTQDGLVGGQANNPVDTIGPRDLDEYAKMGETWSMPTLAYVNSQKNNAVYQTDRAPTGVDFAIFMGSGYGATGEGTTHYTLDALSGDVIAAVDVGSRPAFAAYPNALVANSVSFNRVIGFVLKNAHPWSFESERVYIGDLHGRLWKFLTVDPRVAIQAADLGTGQAVGTAVALIASSEDPAATEGPFVFVSSGADRRAPGPFRNFTFIDKGSAANLTVGAGVFDAADGVTTYPPVEKQFSRAFDQGDPEANCGYTTEAVFRGTVQPAGAFECTGAISGGKCSGTWLWRVFFAGTRLSLPNTKFAPPTPLACNTGQYPCRSQFDSIIYALGAISGQAAYDLNATGDDAYRVFRDSRIAAISMQADPDPGRGGSSFTPDEGLMKGVPKPPPPKGVPPTAQTATANVIIAREPGSPAPSVRYGSSVCQQ